MRDRKRDCCPRCGDRMQTVRYSERTVPGGLWYEVMCHNCCFRMDEFKPTRRKSEKEGKDNVND